MFGTDGIRSKIGTEYLTMHQLPRVGSALARWAQEKYGPQPRILIAQDTRNSGDYIKAALKSGLLLFPVRTTDVHVLPTPAVVQILQAHDIFDCALIISASHNPYYDNGIKVADRATGKITPQDEMRITELLGQEYLPDYTHLGTEITFESLCAGQSADAMYSELITRLCKQNFLAGKKIVLDCAHGATYRIAQQIFAYTGAEIVLLHAQPNGNNINDACGATHVESLQAAVLKHHADIGFAFDGDGDRVIAVNRAGIIKDGDDLLALLSQHPGYRAQSTIVGTVMSNFGFEQWLHLQGKNLVRTAVGDKHIAAYLEQEQLLLGGEQSGHIILKNHTLTGDGILVALKVCEALCIMGNWAMDTFDKCPQMLFNIPVKCKRDLTQEPLAGMIAQAKEQLASGRILVRYSGTEGCLRVMVEASEREQAQFVGVELSKQLEMELR